MARRRLVPKRWAVSRSGHRGAGNPTVREGRKMADSRGLMRRWEEFRPSKTALFWSCTACVVGTLIVGFTWGGWVTGNTAGKMASTAAAGARAEVAAMVCVDRFVSAPDAAAALASLKSSDSWKRDDFITNGGWVTIAGIEKPVEGAAELCAQRLLEAKLPPAKVVGTSG